MTFRLQILGEPRIQSSDGSDVDIPKGKPFALLSYLAVERRPVGRSELGELFWPGSSQKRTRHSVRQAIWLIRRTLGEGVLHGDDPVSVSGEALSCDLLEFEGALEAGRVDHARLLWRGPLLARMSLSGCRSWDHWLEEKRGALHRDFFQALLSQARRSAAMGGREAVLQYLGHALDLNPFSVEAHQLRIETLLQSNELPAARKALEVARRELGDDPTLLQELGRLLKQIEDRESESGARPPERMGRASSSWAGRESWPT